MRAGEAFQGADAKTVFDAEETLRGRLSIIGSKIDNTDNEQSKQSNCGDRYNRDNPGALHCVLFFPKTRGEGGSRYFVSGIDTRNQGCHHCQNNPLQADVRVEHKV